MFKRIIKTASVIFCSLLIVAGGVCIISNSAPADLDAKAFELKSYCHSRGYNTDYGILVDYSIQGKSKTHSSVIWSEKSWMHNLTISQI